MEIFGVFVELGGWKDFSKWGKQRVCHVHTQWIKIRGTNEWPQQQQLQHEEHQQEGETNNFNNHQLTNGLSDGASLEQAEVKTNRLSCSCFGFKNIPNWKLESCEREVVFDQEVMGDWDVSNNARGVLNVLNNVIHHHRCEHGCGHCASWMVRNKCNAQLVRTSGASKSNLFWHIYTWSVFWVFFGWWLSVVCEFAVFVLEP